MPGIPYVSGHPTAAADPSAGPPSLDSPLFATEPLWRPTDPPPAVVVGLPRSGSTFLNHALSRVDEWWFFNDLFFYQQVRGARATDGPMSAAQVGAVLGWVKYRLEYFVYHPQDVPVRLSQADVDAFRDAVARTFAGRPVRWHELLAECLVRLARHHGCDRWGWKTPQDFMFLPALRAAFPGLKVIYLYRDPRAVLASYKFNATEDGHPGQYHPVVYASYWKLAARTMAAAAAPGLGGDLAEVKFEDLVARPREEVARLAAFLGSRLTAAVEGRVNSTFANAKRRTISPTEAWLCERIAGAAMQQKGYELNRPWPRVRDLPGLAWTTARFGGHQLGRVVRSGANRTSVLAFVRRSLGGGRTVERG